VAADGSLTNPSSPGEYVECISVPSLLDADCLWRNVVEYPGMARRLTHASEGKKPELRM
jgi:hypothetical protein